MKTIAGFFVNLNIFVASALFFMNVDVQAQVHHTETILLHPQLEERCSSFSEAETRVSNLRRKQSNELEKFTRCVQSGGANCEQYRNLSLRHGSLVEWLDAKLGVLANIPIKFKKSHTENPRFGISPELAFYLGAYQENPDYMSPNPPPFEQRSAKVISAVTELPTKLWENTNYGSSVIQDKSGLTIANDNDETVIHIGWESRSSARYDVDISGTTGKVCRIAKNKKGLLASIIQTYQLDGHRHHNFNVLFEYRIWRNTPNAPLNNSYYEFARPILEALFGRVPLPPTRLKELGISTKIRTNSRRLFFSDGFRDVAPREVFEKASIGFRDGVKDNWGEGKANMILSFKKGSCQEFDIAIGWDGNRKFISEFEPKKEKDCEAN